MRILLTLFTVIALFVPGISTAQMFDTPPPVEATPTLPAMDFGGTNPQLQAILQLQYQMQILKRVIEREKTVNAMVTASLNVGVSDPYIPNPDYSLCKKVPGNIACSEAYTDLYPEFSQPLPAPMPTPSDTVAQNDTLVPLSADALTETGDLYWLDITCFVTKCSAIVSPNPADLNARYRITVGETLPGGAIVRAISATGVTLDQGSTEIQLEPAPKA